MDRKGRGQGAVHRVAMLGNHLPRQCGIATFTTDLSQALVAAVPDVDCFVLAMNDAGVRHAYPPRVRFEIAEGDISAYRRAADFLNVNSVDVVSVQHEYGIFGAKAGINVLELLRPLRMPIVTTLHTILAEPNATQRVAMDALIEVSERFVVMSTDGRELLRKVHGVEDDKIDVIPHGIPVVQPHRSKDQLGVAGRSVILTFGLLSPDKGIEHVIEALPAIVARYPDTVYVVLGATHPHVKQQHGEMYRRGLESLAERLGVSDNIIFHNRFVEHEELVEFLGAADIYVTPYLKEEQSTSGTLAYAVGCGKAVISTPYRYAVELLSDGRGLLVPWRDSAAIARSVIGLLDDPRKRSDLQERAAAFGRKMSWPIVARSYMSSFERAHRARVDHRGAMFRAATLAQRKPELPAIDLSHVRQLTDDTGILQHATFSIPRYRDGYCTDDNARALLLVTLVEEERIEAPDVVRSLASRYLAFLDDAWNPENRRFRNFMSHARTWSETIGSDDSHGRAVWALGAVASRSADPGRHGLARRLFHEAIRSASELTSPRAWAYVMLGIDEYLRAFQGDSFVAAIGADLGKKLVACFRGASRPAWPWFEDRLTYCNARLPQALIRCAVWLGDPDMAVVGTTALEWLVEQNRTGDGKTFAPIGSNGFHVRGETRATFDQQPVEAAAMVSACLDAARVTGQSHWNDHARRAFEWFFGENALHAPVFDAMTGGCRDGIHVDRMNENQGAESTLSFLLAVAEMRAADRLSRPIPAPISKTRLDRMIPASNAFGGVTQ